MSDSAGVSHMTPEEFRVLGHRMVDAVADYMTRVESMPVLPACKPGDVLRQLPTSAPEAPGGVPGWDAIFADIERVILPSITNWQSPHFYGFFPANASGPAILGELLAAGLGVQGMLWLTSPACTELEMRVLDWLVDALGLPDAFRHEPRSLEPGAKPMGGGVIQSTASDATLVALLAARERARRDGRGGHLTLYTSTQAHSSVIKAAMIAGLAANPEDRTHLRLIDTDHAFAMDASKLEAAVRADLAAGRTPAYVCATIGTTSSTAVDPVVDIAMALRRTGCERAWLHVDAAHSGSALICPELRSMAAGVEHADSFCFNPHKWLLTNFDCDCFFTRDRAALLGALSITPEYLRNSATDTGAIDFRDWQVPLGRRFRALKLWFVIRHYGLEGLRAYIREHVRLAALFEELVRSDDRFEIVAPRTANLVCFRLKAGDDATKKLLDRLNASRRLYMTHTVLPGVGSTIRMAIGSAMTQERHVRAAWDLIRP
ncbi:MAG TPA: pyridoxal-dependent decarboxylase [Phycisphaerales bacterium]